MINCKTKEGIIRTLNSIFIKRGWLLGTTICNQRLYRNFTAPRHPPTDVTHLELALAEDGVEITWKGNDNYYTEVQIQDEDAGWVTLDLFEKGVRKI